MKKGSLSRAAWLKKSPVGCNTTVRPVASPNGRVGREVKVDLRPEPSLVERATGGGPIERRQLPVEVAGDSGGKKISGWRSEHRSEERQVCDARTIDRLRERLPVGWAVAATRDRIEAEPGGPRIGDLMQLGCLLRIARKGKQLRAGEPVRDVYRTARESIQSLDVVGFDFDIHLADRGLRSPVVVEG
jgi:hypothetical protein